MKKLKNTFGENLEQIEIAKLRLKYEELGFDFNTNLKVRINANRRIEIDAYAKHPKTKEEIIFEVKAKESLKKGDTEKLVKRREELIKFFPNARFVLVLAKESPKQVIEDSSLNKLLLDFIKDKELQKLNSLIKQINAESIQSLNIEKIDFIDFKNIDIEGYGNFVFKHFVKNEDFEGLILSDGIPFQFKLKLVNNFNIAEPFTISKDSKILFDISEFDTI
jgi:hypothetical protein